MSTSRSVPGETGGLRFDGGICTNFFFCQRCITTTRTVEQQDAQWTSAHLPDAEMCRGSWSHDYLLQLDPRSLAPRKYQRLEHVGLTQRVTERFAIGHIGKVVTGPGHIEQLGNLCAIVIKQWTVRRHRDVSPATADRPANRKFEEARREDDAGSWLHAAHKENKLVGHGFHWGSDASNAELTQLPTLDLIRFQSRPVTRKMKTTIGTASR